MKDQKILLGLIIILSITNIILLITKKQKENYQCPYGMNWDNWLQRCIPIPPPGIVCPEGEIWNAEFNTCMFPPPDLKK